MTGGEYWSNKWACARGPIASPPNLPNGSISLRRRALRAQLKRDPLRRRGMNPTLLRALLLLVPASALFVASLILFARSKNTGSFLQLMGAGCFVLVVLIHVCEGLGLLPWMQWGRPHSMGHYLDLVSAVLAVTLSPIGYWLARKQGRRLTCA